jgi:hypothetical protein
MSGISKLPNVPELRGLNKNEKDRVDYFLKSPGKKEFFLFRRMLGKTPAQVRNMMVKEFIQRYDLAAYADEIENAFPSKRSWRDLDLMIDKFAGAMDVEEHRLFWDKMRYVLEAIPQHRDYGDKYGDAHGEQTSRPKRGWKYATCKLCWRIVSYNPGVIRKTASFCFMHNLPAMNPVYRKHRRLLEHLLSEQQPVVKKFMALIEACPSESEAEAQDVVYSQLTAPDGCLPRLAKYLKGIDHDGTHESLLWAFHGPASEIKDSLYKDALEEYIQRILNRKDILDPSQPMPIFSIDELSRAEAWLTLLERDGRRK